MSPAGAGGFATSDGRWVFSGTLTFMDAAAVFADSHALPLPAAGVVDLSSLQHADSSALAVMLALKRRANAEGVSLTFTDIPPGLVTLAHVYGVKDLLAA